LCSSKHQPQEDKRAHLLRMDVVMIDDESSREATATAQAQVSLARHLRAVCIVAEARRMLVPALRPSLPACA